ncbi:hypothetical protein ACWGDS_03600 [Streptomyces sp. NPDC055059]|jgi:hypothetical protein|uniref:hypothetical protein n=1 Tax=unclassified Streptomyces TaxID=2593676 RepID=UPI002259DE49|nr:MULTISPECIES: hypothetical protein [unclassified Streptomyces]MCX4647830.1 hypothetical protein [Streptomyces sp. NBC_01446]MCX5320408.1 hypothetical protein [Streptomyces sp. NBC_00120]
MTDHGIDEPIDEDGAVDEAMIRRAGGWARWAVLSALSLFAIGQAGERALPGGKPA